MTNAEYIKQRITDRDLVNIVSAMKRETQLGYDAYDAWQKWAGNNTVWSNKWHFNAKKGKWECSGRTDDVSVQVWLSMQYNPKEWENNK